MLIRELLCAAAGWALAAAVWIAASRLPRSLLSDAFGADGLPRGLAVALALLSTLIAVRAAWAHGARRTSAPPVGKAIAPVGDAVEATGDAVVATGEATARAAEAITARDHLRALGIAAIGFAYVALAPAIGFLPAVALLIAATTLYYGARWRASLAAISLAGAVALWFIFAWLLGISMPAGLWAGLAG